MVAAGEVGDMKKTWCYPTVAQRVAAGETLLRKLLPDLRSTELKGDISPAFAWIERRIVDPVSEAPEPAQSPATGNGLDKVEPPEARDLADRCTVDVITKRRRL